MKKEVTCFHVSGNQFIPETGEPGVVPALKPGAYTLHLNPMSGDFWFSQLEFVTDGIVDLPSVEYSRIVDELNHFLKPEVKAKYLEHGFVYKRSALLHGKPGTGKTVIVNRIARDIIKSGGICLWVTQPNLLPQAFKVLNDTQPDTLVGVIFEEFDAIAQKNESDLLTILDGQVQKNNVIYLATTNYLDKVAKRLYRPGRFASVIEVVYPIAEVRRVYLQSKLGDIPNLDTWVTKTEGLSIDELKEIVQACAILGAPLDETINRIRVCRGETPTLNLIGMEMEMAGIA